MFTGDRSGDWLFRAMHRAGLANQPTSVSVDDGLSLTGAWVTAAVKCAPPDNKPLPDERAACRPFLQRELELLTGLRVVVCLGAFAYEAACAEFGVRPRPKFGHGVEATRRTACTLLCSFHPSQQNTFTGRLTEAMLDDVFARAVGAQRPLTRFSFDGGSGTSRTGKTARSAVTADLRSSRDRTRSTGRPGAM